MTPPVRTVSGEPIPQIAKLLRCARASHAGGWARSLGRHRSRADPPSKQCRSLGQPSSLLPHADFNGSPGALSPSVYWWRDDQWEQITGRDNQGKITVRDGAEIGAVIHTLSRTCPGALPSPSAPAAGLLPRSCRSSKAVPARGRGAWDTAGPGCRGWAAGSRKVLCRRPPSGRTRWQQGCLQVRPWHRAPLLPARSRSGGLPARVSGVVEAATVLAADPCRHRAALRTLAVDRRTRRSGPGVVHDSVTGS